MQWNNKAVTAVTAYISFQARSHYTNDFANSDGKQ